MDPTDPVSMRGQTRVFTTQLVICLVTGVFALLLFCVLRYRWPHIYAVRTLRRSLHLDPLPKKYFGWISVIHRLSDHDVLASLGLDAYVFLAFFKMGIRIFAQLAILAVFVLSPARYYFTGNYDKDGISVLFKALYTYTEPPTMGYLPFRSQNASNIVGSGLSGSSPSDLVFSDPPDFDRDFPPFLWVYPIFTYIFSIIVYVEVFRFTKTVLRTRQKYLARQDSITDRTIRLDGIPHTLMRSPAVLTRFIEDLGIGRVTDVKFIYDWSPLEVLFAERARLIRKLELAYSEHMLVDIYNQLRPPRVLTPLAEASHVEERDLSDGNVNTKLNSSLVVPLAAQLQELDGRIRALQNKFDTKTSTVDLGEFRRVPSAFITMDSVALAQMAAQTVLDPRVYKLLVSLAPAPKDIKWDSFKLSATKKLIQSYMVTVVIVLSYGFIIFLVTPLTTLLDLKTISKVWPALGHFISRSKWLTTFVTGILPPLLFLCLNILLPYFYRYLLQHQGYALNSDIELSTLSKNFFFIFFNLFLVFMVTGTIWDYMLYISDTTKIAYQLARSLKKLSLFYVDLILLQGLAMFPVRLLQVLDFLVLNIVAKLFLLKSFFLRTPRDYRAYYYTPQVFDFGILLPQHLLIFMIILIYLVVLTKIVTSGLAYFVLGAYVYKYQLVYNFVHPPHSTGKVWPMIFRRVMLGLVIFQLFMCGTLALEGALLLAALSLPLLLVTAIVLWNFERYYLPLSTFIALRAIQNPDDFDKEFDESREGSVSTSPSEGIVASTGEDYVSTSPNEGRATTIFNGPNGSRDIEAEEDSNENTMLLRKRRTLTIDEEREQFTDYTHPYLVDPLHGPWIGFEGDYISMVEYLDSVADLEDGDTSVVVDHESEVVMRKRLRVSEWE